MEQLRLNPIGYIEKQENRFLIRILPEYKEGLMNVKDFSHLHVIWWGHLFDESYNRKKLVVKNLFKNGPDETGVFATRSPARPNPILISSVKVEEVDIHKGILYTPFIDAEVGTPVVDIKPYFPMERIKHCQVPHWCQHWPQWQEDTTDFNWQHEIHLEK